MKLPHLRSRLRRGRWFHTYVRGGKETSLGVHGLHPTDPRVFAAYCAAHARYEHSPRETKAPKANTFAWAVDIYRASPAWAALADSTRADRDAILRRYLKAQGDRPLNTISRDDLERALYAKGGHAARNELHALAPVFAHAARLRIIPADVTKGIVIDKPASQGFPTASADDIAAFQKAWAVGTVERLAFDLALYTGAARADLVKLSRRHVSGDLLSYTRRKTATKADIPLTPELRAVLAPLPDIAPAFLLSARGKPFAAKGLGNMFERAAKGAGVSFRLHGLRKAFCVYWAEKGASTSQIAAMAGHMSLAEVARYTRDADRRRMVQLLVGGG